MEIASEKRYGTGRVWVGKCTNQIEILQENGWSSPGESTNPHVLSTEQEVRKDIEWLYQQDRNRNPDTLLWDYHLVTIEIQYQVVGGTLVKA